ncbi:MAG: hypothetical protein PF795_02865, partial [Kiritimatiellae bacterium]|nr:hypothetical protein [Kiritimatiellia bacterium]
MVEQKSETVKLNTGEEVDVDILAVGATDTTFFVGFNPGEEDAIGFGITDASFLILNMTEVEPAAGQTARVWSAIKAEIGTAGFMGLDQLEISGSSIQLALNRAAAGGSLVDFSTETGRPIPIGNYGFEFEFQRSDVTIAKLAGTFRFKAFGLIDLEIELDIMQTFLTIDLSDGSTTEVGMFTFAIEDVSFFAGYEGIGLSLEDASLGMALAVDLNPLTFGRIWFSAIATTSSVGFQGSDVFEVSATDMKLVINTTARDGVTANYSQNPLHLRKGFGASLGPFDVGGDLSNIVIDLQGDLLGIQGDLTVDLLGVLTIDGTFSFVTQTRDLILTDGSTVTVQAIEFSAIGANGFLGFPGNETLDRIGFVVEDLNMGFGIYADITNPLDKWTLLNAQVGRLGFVGLPGINLDATDLALSYLQLAASGLAINYSLSPITFGNPDLDFDLSVADLGLDLGLPDIGIGDLALEFPDVTVDWPNLTLPDLLSALADLNLPGITLTLPSVDIMDLWPDVTLANLSLEFPDLDIDWPNPSLTDLLFNLPKLNLPGLDIGMEFPELPDFGSVFGFLGDFEINLFDLVTFEQFVDLKMEFETVVLSDGSQTEVVYASFAISDIDIFAGIEGVGLQIDDIQLAAAVLISPTTGGVWVTGVARSQFVGLVGIPGLSLEAQSVEVVINTADVLGRDMDFEAKPLEIPVGINFDIGDLDISIPLGDGSVIIDTPGSAGAQTAIYVGGALFSIQDVVHLSGDFSFIIASVPGTNIVTSGLLPGVLPIMRYFAIAGSNVDAFLGFGTPYFGEGDPGDTFGVYASGVDFGFVKWTTGYMSLKFEVDQAGFVGLGDVLSASLSGVKVEINTFVVPVISGPPPGITPAGEVPVLDPIQYQLGQYLFAYMNYTQSFGPQGMELKTGGDSVFIDFDNRISIRASVAWAEFAVADFLFLEGSFMISIGELKQFVAAETGLLKQLSEGLDLPVPLDRIYHDVEIMTIGAINVSGFAGIGDWKSDDRVGVAIDNANFGMALIRPTGLGGLVIPGLDGVLPTYIAVKAHVESGGLVGMEDYLNVTVENVEVNINTSSIPGLPPAMALLPLRYIEFTQSPLPLEGF